MARTGSRRKKKIRSKQEELKERDEVLGSVKTWGQCVSEGRSPSHLV